MRDSRADAHRARAGARPVRAWIPCRRGEPTSARPSRLQRPTLGPGKEKGVARAPQPRTAAMLASVCYGCELCHVKAPFPQLARCPRLRRTVTARFPLVRAQRPPACPPAMRRRVMRKRTRMRRTGPWRRRSGPAPQMLRGCRRASGADKCTCPCPSRVFAVNESVGPHACAPALDPRRSLARHRAQVLARHREESQRRRGKDPLQPPSLPAAILDLQGSRVRLTSLVLR